MSRIHEGAEKSRTSTGHRPGGYDRDRRDAAGTDDGCSGMDGQGAGGADRRDPARWGCAILRAPSLPLK